MGNFIREYGWTVLFIILITATIGFVIDELFLYPKFQISSFFSKQTNNGTAQIPFTISNIKMTNITSNNVVITWDTSKNTTGRVTYCKVSANSTCGSTDIDSTLKMQHKFTLSDLSPNTIYKITLTCLDAKQNQIDYVLDDILKTLPEKINTPLEKDIRPPLIISQSENITSLTISWTTDEPSIGKVVVWSEPASKKTYESTVIGPNHTVHINDADIYSKTIYYYLIALTDASGNINVSEIKTFKSK